MANKKSELFKSWLAQAESSVKEASVKLAADQGNDVKDPTNKGTVAIPDCGDGSNRKLQNLPPNANNFGDDRGIYNLMSVTKPNGVGQGSYITPKNGTEADKDFKSPTTPLDKLAQNLQTINGSLKQAANDVPLPASFTGDNSLMAKLAALGEIMMGSESGQRAVQSELEKRAGIEEARAILAEAAASLEKEATLNFYNNMYADNTVMTKAAAAAAQAHGAWFDSFNTDMEKLAYASGAQDGDVVADAIEAGEPDDENITDISDEEFLQYLQQLIESGQISQEEAEAVLNIIGDDADDGLTGEELASAIEQAVQSGEITPEQGTAIAQELMAGMNSGAEPDDVDAAAADATEKTAAVINHLWTPNC